MTVGLLLIKLQIGYLSEISLYNKSEPYPFFIL